MTTLIVTIEIEKEIDLLYAEQPDVADDIEILLENLFYDSDLLEQLHKPSTYHFHTPVFEVKIFTQAIKDSFNIYILKFQDLNGYLVNYRIFLGFNAQRDTYYALALTHRSYSYDTNHEAYRDLCYRYEQYGIPKIC